MPCLRPCPCRERGPGSGLCGDRDVKFLVDVCAGRRLAEWLRARGHEAAEVRQRASNMEDDDILAWAYAEGRVVVTVDKDFGALAVALEQPHHGIIRLPDVSAVQHQHLLE
ncbi:MAG: hypothetical protein FJ278_24090, partial [Planctomycetes bacterium]|nr:hypothetical protein [Planctomycetota bacterium]